MMEEIGEPPCHRFLLTGSVAVGKSTTLHQFRSIQTHDEWTEERAPGMERDPSTLTDQERQRIDAWVMNQLNLKNIAMLDAAPGLHLMDRAPLDAFAFTRLSEWKQKARMIRTAVGPGKSRRQLAPAHIILLLGDADVLAVRALAKHKVFKPDALREQQELLKRVYGVKRHGVSVVDTRDRPVRQVVKEVAAIVHRKEYVEAPLQNWLAQIETGKIHG